jgi:2-polyprenyl-3-methyl-5-hydroxy-6-metoxy-1,4-benzoquinol methylase
MESDCEALVCQFHSKQYLPSGERKSPEQCVHHMIDHSLIYKSNSVWHWHHRRRLEIVLDAVAEEWRDGASSYADVGCSNCHITNMVVERTKVATACGFDHSDDLLEAARSRYPEIKFSKVDLNQPVDWHRQFDVVTCFETLEHVGDLNMAVKNLAACVKTGGKLILSVPIEIGPWGVAKFFAKLTRGYKLDELPGDVTAWRYTKALLLSERMSTFRDARSGCGTHFGFDFRDVCQIPLNPLH